MRIQLRLAKVSLISALSLLTVPMPAFAYYSVMDLAKQGYGKTGEDGNITGREEEAANKACNEQLDLWAGYDPQDSAAAQADLVQGSLLNAATAVIGGQQAGQGSNQKAVNANVEAQAKRKQLPAEMLIRVVKKRPIRKPLFTKKVRHGRRS